MHEKQADNGFKSGRKMFLEQANWIITSLSGGKDSVAQTILLVERFGPKVIAHYQVLPEDWPETLPYVQDICNHLGIRLVAQQAVYEPTGDGRGVHRAVILDIHSPSDIVRWGNGVIAGATDLALRRGWPPSAASRFCTSYFKRDLLNAWLVQNRDWLGEEVVIALGERAAESPRRAKKPEFWPRIERRGWTVWNWLPVHQLSRRQVFRLLHDYGFEPHPAYRAQGMTPRDMLDKDEEGGPRTACRFCIYASVADVCHQAQIESNRGLLSRIAFVEQVTGKTWWPNFSASQILVKVKGVQDEMG